MNTVESLIYVCTQGSARIREITERLASATPRQTESLLKTLQRECDTTSAGLARLSTYEIPDEETLQDTSAPTADPRLILVAKLGVDAVQNGFCACGGVIAGEAPMADITVHAPMKKRAREQASKDD
ncbi:hypothetical protein SAMN04488077_1228 [Roseovarius tolerans]|uniref:Uncharacterized protein n=1 Tax=Roseovarius tolerans TaxID=74031 RepID=A0A1H8I0D7_9RHOB|nr:hypothetical protein [Roseovarius tolerans]SEN61807.1 hypothetical protein SAMN04488077_1228 [Roseovarius tolerans]